MSGLFWLTNGEAERLKPFFPKSHAPPKTLYTRCNDGETWGPNDKRGHLIGRKKDGLDTKLHPITDAKRRPLTFFMAAGQVSDHTGAAALASPVMFWRQRSMRLDPNQEFRPVSAHLYVHFAVQNAVRKTAQPFSA